MNRKIMLTVAGVLVVAAVVTGVVVRMNNAKDTKTAQTQTTATPTPATAKALDYDGVEGKTALELLKAKDPSAQTKGEGTNAYVTTINGYTASDTNKEFWALYVNGKQSEVGAGSYVTKASDKIEWKIEKY